MIKITRPQFREAAIPLFKPAPYKVMHGGRGAGKSWDFARALLILGTKRKLYILCTREFQRSIKESVHKLLSDQIEALELSYFYTVLETEIIGANGTRIVFAGLRNHIQAIKSMEGVDVCAVFEAATITHSSWETLLPTIRRDAPFGPFGTGSEVWIEFNPELKTDETYKRWVVSPPADAVVIRVNWRDNPWFPEILNKQRIELKNKDYDAYLTVWEGNTRRVLEGAIYAKELAAAIEDGRVVPNLKHIRAKPVIVTFDLGRADMTSMWFWQQVGTEHHAIDFYENCGFDFSHYLEEIQNRRYQIGGIWLPHDGAREVIEAKKSVERQARDAYPTEGVVRIVPRVSHSTKINAMRQLFPRVWINEDKCDGGIRSLQHYQFGVHPETKQRTKEPLHNWASHAANASEYYAVQLIEGNKVDRKEAEEVERQSMFANGTGTGWMS